MTDQISVEINFEGKITVDVDHAVGPSCQKLLEPFDELGKKVDSGFKPEYYKRQNAMVRENVRTSR